jgi:RND family efflux transporter MFP subunit
MNGSGATLLTTIVSTSPIYLYVDVDEASSLKYRRLVADGKLPSALNGRIPCKMALGDEEGWPHDGYIDFIDNRVDPATGTIRARAVFEKNGRQLSPGFFARLQVAGSSPYSALTVPDSCVGSDQAMKYVLVVDEKGLAQRRPVKLGPLIGANRVVRDGLTGDEKVIVNGQARVMGTGVPVQIDTTPAGTTAQVSPSAK